MDIDERLEKLTARHEALTQTVKLLAHENVEHSRHIAEHSRQIAELLEAAKQDGENIRALARIAEIHERRLTTLEGGEPNA